MSTIFHCGPPGSGKSYHVVKEVIIPALKKGRKIVTNLPVKLDVMATKIKELNLIEKANLLEMIEDDKIRNIHELVGDEKGPYSGCLIVIDEAHDYWPTDEPIKNKEFKGWYTKQRHYFQDVVLLTQDYMNVHKYMRSVMKARYEYSKNDDKGFSNGYNKDYYALKSKSRPIRTFHSYDKFYYQFYYSHSKALADSGLVEQKVGKKINILFRYIVQFGLGVVCFIGAMSLYFGRMNEKIEAGKDLDPKDAVKITYPGMEKNKASFSPVGVGQNLTMPGFLQGSYSPGGSTPKETNQEQDWCRNSTKAYVGVGTKKDGSLESKLSGHIVVGVIGVGSRSLYLFKTLEGHLRKKKIEGSPYAIGQKVCL